MCDGGMANEYRAVLTRLRPGLHVLSCCAASVCMALWLQPDIKEEKPSQPGGFFSMQLTLQQQSHPDPVVGPVTGLVSLGFVGLEPAWLY